jgi:hypothetical protein
MVKHSEPPVLEDHKQRERNHLLVEEQKQKKDATKRKHDENIRAKEALEKRRRQQACDRLPQEESPLEPDSDDEDFDIFSDKEKKAWGFSGEEPPQGAPTRGLMPQGSLMVPKERAGVWPLSPSELMVLRGGALPWCRGLRGPRGA